MKDRIEELNRVFNVDIRIKSKSLRTRYLRLCFYEEFQDRGIKPISITLGVQQLDVRRYKNQITGLESNNVFQEVRKAYKTLDYWRFKNAFDYPLRGNYPTEATDLEIPYSVMEVIDIMKPHKNFNSPLWDKRLKHYTEQDWHEIEQLKNKQI